MDIGLRGLRLTFIALASSAGTPRDHQRAGGRGFLLSWYSPACAPLPFGRTRVHSRRAPRSPPSGRWQPTIDSRSALVVPLHLDGLLRANGCGFVAPRCRPWGSSRFAVGRLVGAPEGARQAVVPFLATRFVPFEGFPSSTAAPHHCGPCPRAVTTRFPHIGRGRCGTGMIRYRNPSLPCDDAPIRRGEPPLHRSRRCAGHQGGRRCGSRHQNRGRAEILAPPGAGGCPKAPSRAGRRVAEATRARRAGVAGRETPSEPGDPAVDASRWRGGSWGGCRCQRPPSVPLQRSSRLQGIAPLTSPLRPTAVSSGASPVPPMGFVPLQDPSSSAPAPEWGEPTARRWWTSTERGVASHASLGPQASLRRSPARRLAEAGRRTPNRGAKADPRRRPFSGCERGPREGTHRAHRRGGGRPASQCLRSLSGR
jgi:hypothetical protein